MDNRGSLSAAPLLVVCQANLVRSPLTAGLLRRRLEKDGRHDLVVRSGGLVTASGAVVSAEAVDVARDLGIELQAHRPTTVTAQLLADSGLVVTMTETQRNAVERLVPAGVSRTFTALELVRLTSRCDLGVASWAELAAVAHARRPLVPPASGTEDVPDPVGRDLSFHRQVARQLVEICDRVAVVLARPVPSV